MPGNQYRVFMIADGFGIHAKLIGNAAPDPKTGRVTVTVRRPAAGAFRRVHDAPLRLRSRATGDPDALLHLSGPDSPSSPGTTARRTEIAPSSSASTRGPGGAGCPGATRPFQPRLVAGTSNPIAGDFSNFTLKLDRDDGDQFLGDLNFRMPPGFTGSLRGITYCPRPRSPPRPRTSAATEQAAPSCPASSQIGTTNVAAGPGTHPFHAVGKMYLAGPVQRRAAEPRRDHPGARRPLRLRRRRRPGRAPRRPARRPGHARSPTPSRRSSAASRSGCARSRSTSTGRTSRSTRPTAAPLTGRLAGHRRPGHGRRLLAPTSRRSNCAHPSVQAEDGRPPGRQGRQHGRARTRACISTFGPGPATPTSNRSR